MAVTIENVLQANMVLVGVSLINTADELAAFRQGVRTEVTTSEAGWGTEVVNRAHALDRDRIKVTRSPDRSAIAREYPTKSDLKRLAQVASIALMNTNLEGQSLLAFGYNIELVFDTDPSERAIQYLFNRLFMPDLLRDGGRQLFGGTGRLYFEKGGPELAGSLGAKIK